MVPRLRSDFSVLIDDSVAFARISGDYNPLHIDPVVARRTRFGGTVTHGIHLFLRALDEIAAQGLLDRQEPVALSASYHGAVLTGTTVSMRASSAGEKLRFCAESDGRPAFTGTIELKPAVNIALPIDDSEFPPASPHEEEFPPSVTENTVPVKLSRGSLAALFPSLARLPCTYWIADLLATSQIVGMRCPGMLSIYSSFQLRRPEEPVGSLGLMHFHVTGVENRLSLLRLQVIGAYLCGTLEASFRSRAVEQPAMKEVAALVSPTAFAGDRTLIVGGSRGLGEVTAKIAAAGGAEVAITYALGKKDAERVCDEVRAFGATCTAYHMDVLSSDMQNEIGWLETSLFSHVYFFASPLISKNVGGWNEALFRQYTDIYVAAFAVLVEHMLRIRAKQELPVNFLYPSSIFVTQPAKGFTEYAVAKAAGEALCDQLQGRLNARFAKPRLPRMRTDQTSTLVDGASIDPLPVMLNVIRAFHSPTWTT